jgi:hypothetical protein
MASWIEPPLDIEDMRRRCSAHNRWMTDHPEMVKFAESWADHSVEDLPSG